MLKLDTQPRSRQKRTGWRATPGHGGGWSVPPPPPNASSDAPEEACRGPRGAPEQAGVAARARASGTVGGRSVSPAQEQSGEPSSERRSRSARWWSVAALFFPAQEQSDGPQVPPRTCPARRPKAGTRRASGENAAGGGRESRDIPSGQRRDPVRPRSGHSRSPHARRLGANVDQRQDGGKGQDRGRCRNRRVTAQDAVRRNSLRPDGQNAPPPPRVGERRATTKKRVDRSHLGPHEAAQQPMLVRSPTPPFFTGEDQVLDLR